MTPILYYEFLLQFFKVKSASTANLFSVKPILLIRICFVIQISSSNLYFLFLGTIKVQMPGKFVWIKTDWLLLWQEEVKVPLPAEAQEQQQQLPEHN